MKYVFYICLLATILSTTTPTHATVIFTEDYEVADMAALAAKGWDVINGTELDSTPVMSIVTAPTGRSGKVLRMQYQGVHVDDNHNAKITKTFSDQSDVYERYYVRYEKIDSGQPSGWTDVTSKQHYWNVSTLPDIVTEFLFGGDSLEAANQTNTSHLCPNGSTDVSCNLRVNQTTVHISYDTWYCIETHATDSLYESWVDGVQTISYSSPQYIGPTGWNSMQVYRQGADNQYRYEDDFVVATTRIGCSASGSPAGGGLDF